MSELADLERRIKEALDRIGNGLEQIQAPAPASDTGENEEVAALREALETEKTAVAQLEERLKALRSQNETRIGELEAQANAQKARADEAEAGLAKAQEAAEAAAGTGAKAQVLEAELQDLRKARDTDRAELDDILSNLKPLMEEQTNA